MSLLYKILSFDFVELGLVDLEVLVWTGYMHIMLSMIIEPVRL